MSVGCKKTELIASKRTLFTLLGRNGPEANVRFMPKADTGIDGWGTRQHRVIEPLCELSQIISELGQVFAPVQEADAAM
jgi:hypothetical protein